MLNRLMGIVPDASEHGVHIDQMLEFLHWFIAILFVGWFAYFIYVLFRFHHSRNPVASYQGAKTKATTHIEVSVVIIEAVLLLGFAFPLWAARVNDFPTNDALRVRVFGEQFVWRYHYAGADGKFGRQSMSLLSAANPIGIDWSDPAADDDFTALNIMSAPVDRPLILELHAKDVIHDFAIPSMRIAQDAIPGEMIPMWFTPVKVGEYEVVCAQLCGAGHANMRGVLQVKSEKDYESWATGAAAAENRAAAAPAVPVPAPAH